MSPRHLTDPQILANLQGLTQSKPVNVHDLNEIRKLTSQRGLTRKEKQQASFLFEKYRYELDPNRSIISAS